MIYYNGNKIVVKVIGSVGDDTVTASATYSIGTTLATLVLVQCPAADYTNYTIKSVTVDSGKALIDKYTDDATFHKTGTVSVSLSSTATTQGTITVVFEKAEIMPILAKIH